MAFEYSLFFLFTVFFILTQNQRVDSHNFLVFRFLDDDKCPKDQIYQHCDECKRKERTYVCKKCVDGYFLFNQKCIPCSAKGCEECPQDICLKCYDDLHLVGNYCISKREIPKEKYSDECERYDLKYNCLHCDDDCDLKDGKCKCSKSYTAIIVVVVIIIVVLLIVAGTLIYCCCFKKKQNGGGVNEINVAVQLPSLSGENKNNNLNNKEDYVEYEKIEEKNGLQYYNDEGNNNPRTNEQKICQQCKLEKAFFQLSCGCCLCQAHIGKLEQLVDNTATGFEKCPVCGNLISSVKQILHECGICLENKECVFKFNCGCKFEFCASCSEKVAKSGICPGCRKQITQNIIPIYSKPK